MEEIILLESPNLRNNLCCDENLVILDKVGELASEPETGWSLKEQVIDFYETTSGTLDSTVKRHRKELDQDGYKTLKIKDFRDLHYVSLKSKARKIAIFPRRAVLRIGMLLRDSEVAKRVRTYLLDVERAARPCILQEQQGRSFQAHVLNGLANLFQSQGNGGEFLANLARELNQLKLYQATMFAEVFENHAEMLEKLERIEERLGKIGGNNRESYTL